VADRVAVFRPYGLSVGDRVRVEDGPRAGDWEVIGVTDRKVKLRCPLSGREFEWARFCYFVEVQQQAEWPRPDESSGTGPVR